MPTLRSWPLLIAMALVASASGLPPVMAADFTTGYSYQLNVSGAAGRSGQQEGPAAAGQRLDLSESSEVRNGPLFTGADVVGWSSASNGHLRAALRADAAVATETALQGADIRAQVTSSLSDAIVVNCPTCAAGSLGWMNFRIYYEGTTGRTGRFGQPPGDMGVYAADTTWAANVLVASEGVPHPPTNPGDPPTSYTPDVVSIQYFRLETDRNGYTGISEPPHAGSGLQDLSIQFAYGQPIHLDLAISATILTAVVSDDSNAPFSASATSWIDLSHSLYWDGVTSVQDADGRFVAGYSVVGAGGLDYRQSFAAAVVPEPGTWALMLMGLGVLGALARRRPGLGMS